MRNSQITIPTVMLNSSDYRMDCCGETRMDMIMAFDKEIQFGQKTIQALLFRHFGFSFDGKKAGWNDKKAYILHPYWERIDPMWKWDGVTHGILDSIPLAQLSSIGITKDFHRTCLRHWIETSDPTIQREGRPY